MALDPNSIARLAYAAGFRGQDLRTAVAIAMAESSGNPNAYNPERAAGTRAGRGSYGLWQIYLTAHPEYAGANLYDPLTNAKVAYAVYRQAGNRFTPWSTYNSGSASRIANLLRVDTSSMRIVQSSGVAPSAGSAANAAYVQNIQGMAVGGVAPSQPLVNVSLLPPNVNAYLQSPYAGFNIALIVIGAFLILAGTMLLFGSFFSAGTQRKGK